MSPNATASATDPARALGPAPATRSLSCSGWRDENITGWPSLANIVPSAPPSLPAPIVAILRVEMPCARALDAGPRISAAAKTSKMRRREGQRMLVIARLGKRAVVTGKLHQTGKAQQPETTAGMYCGHWDWWLADLACSAI